MRYCFICHDEVTGRDVLCDFQSATASCVINTGISVCDECDKGLEEKNPEVLARLLARFEEGRRLFVWPQ